MQDQAKKALQLSVVQVLAGALASVSAAVVASTFGLAGTLIGAAVTSVVATTAGALYTHSLERARARIRIRRDPRTGRLEQELVDAPAAPRAISWGLVAGAAALVFVLAIGAVTAVELAARKPVASLMGRAVPEPGVTTVGTVLHELGPQSPAGPPPEPTPEESPATTPTTVGPGALPAGTAPAAAPPTPTATAPLPTLQPTPMKPQPSPTVPPVAPAQRAPAAPATAPGEPSAAPTATPAGEPATAPTVTPRP